MKLALLGDIHANDYALQAVLDAASTLGIEKILITGDMVGYYYAPLRVLELLSTWDKHIVRGNHEDMLNTARSDPAFLAQVDVRYGFGLRAVLEQLNGQQIDELCGLPHPMELVINDCKILLCHGAPWNINQYIYPDAQQSQLERCATEQVDLVVLGHTHYPMVQSVGKLQIVNPGSVGQPRNRQQGAHWAIFDTDTRGVEFRQEEYDTTPLVRECRQRNPEIPYLVDVLKRQN